jgi:hypothetical protein
MWNIKVEEIDLEYKWFKQVGLSSNQLAAKV